MDLLHAQHQSVSQTWPVIVAFGAAPPPPRYNVSRAWVGIVDPYKVTQIVCLPQSYLSIFENFPGVESARQLVSDILPIVRGHYK